MSNHRIQLDIDALKNARHYIQKADKILIISHRNPDADAVGSNSALRIALEKIGKNVESSCADKIPKNLHFIKYAKDFLIKITPNNYDLIITVDCGSSNLVKYHETIKDFFENSPTIINIDHHITNNYFGNINIVDPEGAATAMILYFIFKYLDIAIDTDMATGLMAALYYDTGSFKHSNTSAEVLMVASELMQKKADYNTIIINLFKTTSIKRLQLWGRALSRAKLNKNNILVSNITQQDLIDLELHTDDLSGVIDYLNTLPESKFCMLLTEDKNGNIKGSCRTQRDNIDVSAISKLFGGGGHKKAAGFTIQNQTD